MTATETTTRLLSKLLTLLRDTIPDLQAVYRFGSWGTDAQRTDSDIDLAVLSPSPLPSMKRWDLAQQLAAYAGRDVDLVDLGAASTVMRMEIVARGERIYGRDEDQVEQFEDLVFSAYARFNEERRDILKDIRQRGSIYGQ